MKPDDRALKNYVKDVCSNINKGIFEFDYGYAILKENGMTLYSYEGITYTDYCSPSIYYILYNEETPYHR